MSLLIPNKPLLRGVSQTAKIARLLFGSGEIGALFDPSDQTSLTLEGDYISQMRDKSGNGYHASGSGINRFTLQQDNNYAWAHADGDDDFMTFPMSGLAGVGFYIAFAFMVNALDGNTFAADTFGVASGSATWQLSGFRASGGSATIVGSKVRVNSGTNYEKYSVNGAFSINTPYVLESWHDLTNLHYRLSTGDTNYLAAPTSGTIALPNGTIYGNDVEFRFYAGVYRNGIPPSNNVMDLTRRWLATKNGAVMT